jgi:hypothetical protein
MFSCFICRDHSPDALVKLNSDEVDTGVDDVLQVMQIKLLGMIIFFVFDLRSFTLGSRDPICVCACVLE